MGRESRRCHQGQTFCRAVRCRKSAQPTGGVPNQPMGVPLLQTAVALSCTVLRRVATCPGKGPEPRAFHRVYDALRGPLRFRGSNARRGRILHIIGMAWRSTASTLAPSRVSEKFARHSAVWSRCSSTTVGGCTDESDRVAARMCEGRMASQERMLKRPMRSTLNRPMTEGAAKYAAARRAWNERERVRSRPQPEGQGHSKY